ncbi:MAG: CotS family spore coat protein [Bacillota bacterium]
MNLKDVDMVKINVLGQYDIVPSDIELIKFKDTQKQRAIYKVQSPTLQYCLKKVYYSKADLEFIIYAMKYLESKGLHVPSIIPSKAHTEYIDYHSNLFILMTWISGHRCDYDALEDLKAIAENLGTLHLKTIGFDYLPRSKSRYNYSNWYVDLKRKTESLLTIQHRLNEDLQHRPIYISLSNLFKSQLNMMNESLDLLAAVDFYKIIRKAVINGTLCHMDYVNKNLFIMDKTVFMIDFDRMKLSPPIQDIASLMRRVMRRSNTNWDFETARIILDTYSQVNPLTLDEMKAVLAYIIFPQKLFREVKRYLQQESNESYYLERFEKITRQYEQKEAFVKRFKIHYGIK